MLLGLNLKSLWAGTFHHIANIILRREAEKAGYKNNFTIIDREDAKDLMQDVLEELGISKSDKLFPKKDIILNIWSLPRVSTIVIFGNIIFGTNMNRGFFVIYCQYFGIRKEMGLGSLFE